MLRNKKVFRILTFILIFCTCHLSYSSNEGWQVYLAYREAKQVEAAGSSLYFIMKGSGTNKSNSGNLVRYDTEDSSVQTYDCMHGLSDKEISRISFNKATDCLIILYESGNIDLLHADGKIVNLSALMENNILGSRILNISHYGSIAYLCTDFAIIELDIYEQVVRETYKTNGLAVYGFFNIEDYYYVALNDGLYRITEMQQLQNFNSWTKLFDLEVRDIVHFSGNLYAISASTNKLYYFLINGDEVQSVKSGYSFSRIFASEDEMICFSNDGWFGYFLHDAPTSPRVFKQEHNWSDLDFCNGSIIVVDNLGRIYSFVFDASTSLFVQKSQESLLSINSPKRDFFYRIQFAGERLLVAGGINSQTATYFPVTFMFMEPDGTWVSFDETQVHSINPSVNNLNAVALVQDPNDDKHFFGGVWRNGLHEYIITEDGEVKLKQFYNYSNSPLRSIDVPVWDQWNYCTCTALQYDNNGNLWFANQQTDTIIRAIRPNGKWMSLYYPEITKSEIVLQYLFSSRGINFMVTYECGKRGFFGFDTNGTLNVAEDDRHMLRSTITNQDGTTVAPTQFYCMTEDHDQQIWCGTNEGLYVITNPQDWFDPDFYFHQIKRNRDDGSGLADYLLAGVDVTCIAVDPSNRKWIGTHNNGVYLVSHDGQETIHHFTKANSPLLSDRIHSIAVQPRDGRVMFGTSLGLCSYNEQVIEAESTLSKDKVIAYPNPVTPNTDAMVTIQGLTDDAEVKILNASGIAVWGGKSVGGNLRWNCCNMQGNRVSSGVYHVVCNTEDAGQTVVTRIVVLR